MQDTCGRKIDYLRISITDLCNLRCKYCIPENGVPLKEHKDILSFESIEKIVRAAAALGINKIRFTGGEPLVRRGITSLIQMISEIPGINDVSLTTNGILLGDMAHELKAAGLQRVNISLDSLRPERFREITRGGNLDSALAGIRAAREAGLAPIKINTVLIGGFNDDEIEDLVRLTWSESVDVRFIELMPIGEASGWSNGHFISNETILKTVPVLRPLEADDVHSPAHYYRIPGAVGKVGLINPISSHFCESCNRIRLTADGRLKPCLHSEQEIDLRSALNDPEALTALIRKAILSKPQQHHILSSDFKPVSRNMYQIGG